MHFMTNCLQPAIDLSLIEPTIPAKPRSSKQRYRLTALGRDWLAHHRGDRHE